MIIYDKYVYSIGGSSVLKADAYICHDVSEVYWLTIKDDVEVVEKGLIERLPNLQVLELPDTLKSLEISEEFLAKLREGGVFVIYGTFDSYAEEYAKQHNLRFLHTDIEIAREGDYATCYGVDIVTLSFKYGDVALVQDNFCPGISAGSNGGGTTRTEVPWNFFKDPDAQEKIAEMSWGRVRDEIRNSEILRTFIGKVRERFSHNKNDKFILVY